MKRDLQKLAHKEFDLLVIGGGIYGAAAAWDAALRGLSVALVEKNDFGCATSANSLKVVHGGLRYLQKLDWTRMRESIRERRALLRIAPHLVRPLTFLVPSEGFGKRSRWAMGIAAILNDLISADRNDGIRDPNRRIPGCKTLARADYERFAENLRVPGATGGLLWHDGQAHDPERLVLNFVQSAMDQGAVAANHVRVTGLLKQEGRVAGAKASDELTGQAFEIRARTVLNAAGPWMQELSPKPAMRWVKAINLVTRPLHERLSVGFPSADRRRFFFAAPWREHSLIGTAYFHFDGQADRAQPTSAENQAFLDDLRQALPGVDLKHEDIRFVHWGLLPAAEVAAQSNEPQLSDRYQIVDHASDGLDGLISVSGVKLTTARDVAAKAVDRIVRRLGRPARPSRSAVTPLVGGGIQDFNAFLSRAVIDAPAGISPQAIQHLLRSYGTEYPRVLNRIDENASWGKLVAGSNECIRAAVIHAARVEMAMTLSDVVFRRTGLATLGDPGDACLQECAYLLADELGWTRDQMQKQIDDTRAELALAMAGVAAPSGMKARQ